MPRLVPVGEEGVHMSELAQTNHHTVEDGEGSGCTVGIALHMEVFGRERLIHSRISDREHLQERPHSLDNVDDADDEPPRKR